MADHTSKTDDVRDESVQNGDANQTNGTDQDTSNLDADELELIEARKAAEGAAGEGEGDGKSGAEGQTGAAEGEPPADTSEGEGGGQEGQEGQKGQQRSKVPMIPKPRFDEVVSDKDKAIQEAAYWRGRAEGISQRNQGDQNDGGQQRRELTPDEVISQAEHEKLDLAEKYEAGEVTERERVEQDIALDRRIQDAREQRLMALRKGDGQERQQHQTNDLYLDRLTAQLEDQHPYTTEITDDGHWNFLREEAARQLTREGVKLTEDGMGTFQLRRRMAELTDVYGPAFIGKTLNQQQGGNQSGAKGGQAKPNDDGRGGLSRTAQARKDKLDLAERHPPDTTNLGSSGNHEEISEANIMSMSDDEIAALPEATRRKILAG